MAERFVLTVPETVTARFLVAAGTRAVPGPDRLRDALGARGLGRVAAAMLASSRLTVNPVTEITAELKEQVRRLDGAPDGLRDVFGAARHMTVTAVTAPAGLPRHAQATRLAARTLAAALRGRVADLDTGRILPPEDGPPAEPEEFFLGGDWAPVYITLEPEDATRARAETAGLHRFGLPEVTARHVPYASMLTAANLVRALAWQLFAEQRAFLARAGTAGTRETPAERAVRRDDVMRFWGATERPAKQTAAVRLAWTDTACPACAAAIEARPADPDRDKWWTECATAMPHLIRPTPSPAEPRPRHPR
ncbi:hypothetical protein [Actinomadura latina]|uniref:Uncharacterized protein n=1 Tax=Actinomadura latina TaxID=163603 RepID=A0A846Z3Q8_9ACTN|nr:hypothetical protein [Actinomadura latina]NKZ05404.1 hypothetical protein [Actinomadura latina]